MSYEEKKTIFNVNGGQVNIAEGNATINATQNNGVNLEELNSIVNDIVNNITTVNSDYKETILDAVDMLKDEFSKDNPKKNRLRRCVTLLAPMVTILNGFPSLVEKIGALIDFINKYI